MQPDKIAKKIRKNLLNQKTKLEGYLDLLEKEEEDILLEDPDKLIAHIDFENQIINELSSFKKILEPLEIMYFKSPFKKESALIDIKTNIDKLSHQVKTKTNQNREKLETICIKVKAELKGSSKKGLLKSTYNNVDSRLVDISG
ncbi:MAG: hypothetical protein KAT05_17510 [Spirochaetes bacterium]|nr:hypothetical protein [Spirochaetota bacterium]